MIRQTMGWMGLGLVVLFAAGSAHADFSIKEKKYQADQLTDLKDTLDLTNKTCGTQITEDINFEGFAKAEPDHETHSVSGFCGKPLDALYTLCGDATGKEAVAKKVKKVTCTYGGAGKRAVTLNGGTIAYTVDFDNGDADFIKAYLENNL